MGQSSPRPIAKAPAGMACPICKAPTEASFRPFCSRRCADVDLVRWLRGAYAIPGGEADADEDGDDTAARQQRSAGSSEEE
jgi:uncharacterized protein